MPRGRKASVRYYASRGAYFTHFRGRQEKLAEGPDDAPDGPTYLRALAKFREVMEVSRLDTAGDENLVVTGLDRYGTYLRDQGRESSLRILKSACESAVEEFGGVRVCDLKVLHVQAWLDKMGKDRGRSRGNRIKKWGPTQKRMAVDKLVTALNWAAEQGIISRNPIKTKPLVKDLKGRGKVSRGREYVLRPGDQSGLLAAAKPFFADLLAFLEATGCRPGEAYNVTAAHYHRADGTLVFPHDASPPDYVHKTAKRTGRDRVIYLTDALVGVVERLAQKYPTGPLFRNRDGKPWTTSAVHLMLKRLTRRLGIKGKVIPYSWRHTFATRWLLKGGSIKILADLMGNSVGIIEKHYGHLEVDKKVMRQRLLEIRAHIEADEEAARQGHSGGKAGQGREGEGHLPRLE